VTAADDSHRRVWLLFLAGPVLWFAHFMAVYVLVESGCAAGGTDLELLGLDVMALVTVVATVVAAGVALAVALVALRRWRRADDADVLAGGERESGLALAGMLLGFLFVVAILFTGFPAVHLRPC
jgi:heme/copper-type cytochrome/quinol oxidase subunit 3